jgi:uncharacterized protein HemX
MFVNAKQMRKLVIIFLINLTVFGVSGYGQKTAQKDTQKIKLPAVVENGDTIGIYTLADTRIDAKIDEATAQKQKDWERLYNNVRFLMPYAITCSNKINEIDAKMNDLDKRHDKKKYLRAEREQLVKNYSAKLKDLSDYQAAILIKLIYKQTGHTSYELIHEYESGFTAGFWQTLARLDGLNLKDTYDPEKDTMIALALKMSGY